MTKSRVLGAIASVVLLCGALLPAASAHSLRPAGPPPPYVLCSTTKWVTDGAGYGPILDPYGVYLTTYLKVLVDARYPSTYCDDMQGWTHFQEQSSACNFVIEVGIVDDLNVFDVHGTTAGGCGASGDAFSTVGNPVAIDGCGTPYHGRGYYEHDSNTPVDSYPYTPSC